jgi:hypothetical protein
MSNVQILLVGLSVLALSIAIVAYVKTPPLERFTPKIKIDGVNYAPMYTPQEKIHLLLTHALWAVPFVTLLRIWFFPHFKQFAAHANCFNWGAINGMHLVFYGVFVGVPLIMALMGYLFTFNMAVQTYKSQQFPPPNYKTLHLTPYKYGLKAKLLAVFWFGFLGVAISFAMWGGWQAHALTQQIPACTVTQ